MERSHSMLVWPRWWSPPAARATTRQPHLHVHCGADHRDDHDCAGAHLHHRAGAATTTTARPSATRAVGDGPAKVTAAHGALMTFCCESKVASVTHGANRMIVVVADDTQKVVQLIGGDRAFWSRSIAD